MLSLDSVGDDAQLFLNYFSFQLIHLDVSDILNGVDF